MKNIIKKQISLEDAKSRLPGVLYYIDQEDELIDECTKYVSVTGNYNKIISDIEIPSEFIDSIKDFTDVDINIPKLSGGSWNNEIYELQPYSEQYISKFGFDDVFYYIKTDIVEAFINPLDKTPVYPTKYFVYNGKKTFLDVNGCATISNDFTFSDLETFPDSIETGSVKRISFTADKELPNFYNGVYFLRIENEYYELTVDNVNGLAYTFDFIVPYSGNLEISEDLRLCYPNKRVITYNDVVFSPLSGETITIDNIEYDLVEVDAKQMANIYDRFGGLHRYLRYPTLLKWFRFFIDYYESLKVYDCKTINGVQFYSFNEMFIAYPELKINYDLSETTYLDVLALNRGGKSFFEWMSENCFTKYKTPQGTTLPEYLYYPQVIEEISWFGERYPEYSGITSESGCTIEYDCCDCSEYFQKGGNDTHNWLLSIVPPTHNAETKTASVSIPLLINTTVENLGEFTIFSSEFDENTDYSPEIKSSGLTLSVLYEGNAYFLKGTGNTETNTTGPGYNYSERYKDKMFGNLNPENFDETTGKYNEYNNEINKQWANSMSGFTQTEWITISGLVESKLSGLEDKITFSDDNLNDLPGSFVYDGINKKYIIPVEDETLDIVYHVRNSHNLKPLDNGNLFGKIIYSIKAYKVDFNNNENNILAEYANSGNTTLNIDIDSIYDLETNGPINNKDGVYLEITYYDNCEIAKDNNSALYPVSGMVLTNDNKTIYTPISGYTLQSGDVFTAYPMKKLVETFFIERVDITYELDNNNGFTIKAYELNSIGNELMANMEMLIPPANELNNFNNFISTPIIKREIYLGSSSKENRNIDIYIDRGNGAAFEKHLKLGEISTFNDLLQYGNGYFNVINVANPE